MPWVYQGWHSGGNANNELIGFEICEPKDYSDEEAFKKLKNLALNLCLYLCEVYELDETMVTSHCEAHQNKGKAYASNHSDLDHWWKKYHNYSMDDFRAELKEKLNNKSKQLTIETGIDALEYLVSIGKILDKEYWLKVLETTRQVEYIFIKWAKDIVNINN